VAGSPRIGSGGPSIAALAANDVQLLFDTISGSKALADGGKLRALAVTSAARSPVMPAVPTVSESGLRDFSVVYWLGIFAPAKTPQAVLDRLHREVVKALAATDVRQRFADEGADPVGSSPAEFAAFYRVEADKWGDVVKRSGSKLD